MRVLNVEFYNRLSGELEHNGGYPSLEEAALHAQGRVMIVAGVEEIEEAGEASVPSADFLHLEAALALERVTRVEEFIQSHGWTGDGVQFISARDIGRGRELVIYQMADPGDASAVVHMDVGSSEPFELAGFMRDATYASLGCPSVGGAS